ncbi:MAG: phospho-sugar mutase, partial [Patescibacteria group bacterium]|nr:phospho-sugar mutase [Patescibacteria group bacterium]
MDFGTGGLRGIRGVGTNRMNEYVIGKATQGLANYMLQNEGAKGKGIVIAYDSRIMSPEFALQAALVMAGNGIKAYLFESLRSTPELSFAVRELGALSGIVVTASHNPPEYNGYKVYWDDGAQVVAPHDKSIIEEVNKIENLSEIKLADEEEAKKAGLLNIIGKEIDDKFIAAVKKLVIKQENIDKVADTFKMVYTPLHGTGNRPVQRILKEVGFKNVEVVKEQEQPDGNFPTVGYPNPESPAVFELGIKLAEKTGAKLVLANDPDADRIGTAVQTKSGEWIYPNGNQIGILLTEYILKNKKDIPENAVVISTIVSSPMLDAVVKANNVNIIRTLTGFKFIGEKIKGFEEGKEDYTYLFGFEESYGYLAGTHARDKDAVVATMLIAEMAASFEAAGSSIAEEIDKMYEKYGYFREDIEAVTMEGKEGAEKIAEIMSNLRENAPTELLGKKVKIFRDYLKKTEKNLIEGKEVKLTLPESNVLQFVLEDDTYITARPSGTEPKVKFYFGINAETKEAADEKIKITKSEFVKTIK